MVYTDENGYKRWRRLAYEERVGQNRWEELLEYTDAFMHYHRIRGVESSIYTELYTDIKENRVYFRVFRKRLPLKWVKSKNPGINTPLTKMAPICGKLRKDDTENKIAFAVDIGLKPYGSWGKFYNLIQIDPSIKAEEAMACIAARGLEMEIEWIDPVYSPLKRLVHRIENDEERRPIRTNFNAQRCKDELEKFPYTQLTIYITCMDDLALVILKERIPAYEVVIVREYAGRRMLELAVPRLGLEEEIPGPLRWKYDGVRLYPE